MILEKKHIKIENKSSSIILIDIPKPAMSSMFICRLLSSSVELERLALIKHTKS